jgi:peptidoglycan/xylan/chitin deacetylase (PgdA/CDA1 family)
MPERADDSMRWILKRGAKALFAAALSGVGVHLLVRRARRAQAGGARVLVLSYHRITPDFGASARESLPSLLVSTATLRRQLEHVARSHDLVSLADARRILADPAARPGRDVVAVTFDDGYADNAEHALPVLAALRVPATVFIPTGYIGTARRLPHDRLFATLSELRRRGIPLRAAGLSHPLQRALDAAEARGPAATLDRLISRLPHPQLVALADGLERRTGIGEGDLPRGTRLLSWAQVRTLRAAGMEIGGHTVNHAVLANLPIAEARREIAGCREAIVDAVGVAPRHFAYPNGYHTPAVRRALADHGFEAGLTIEDEENRRGADAFRMKRKVLWENTTKGPLRYSASVATCNIGGVFHALRLASPVPGERADPPDAPAAGGWTAGPSRVAG